MDGGIVVINFRGIKVISFSKQLAEDVRRYRKKHHLNQTQFGELVATSQRTISDLEGNAVLPITPVLDKIHDLLYGEEISGRLAEDRPVYHAQRNFVRWLQDILKDEIPYEDMIQILRDAVDAEAARVIRNKPAQKDANKKDQASGGSP